MDNFDSEEDYLSHLRNSLLDSDQQEGVVNGGESEKGRIEKDGDGQVTSDDDLENDPEKRQKVGNPYERGTVVYSNRDIKINVKSVNHVKKHRYAQSDHLYQISIVQKDAPKKTPPFLTSLENGLKQALIHIVNNLKKIYGSNLHHQA